jgi:uncharacterized protein Veg
MGRLVRHSKGNLGRRRKSALREILIRVYSCPFAVDFTFVSFVIFPYCANLLL